MSASIAYVLSTRAISAALIEEAAANGIVIDVVPFIDTITPHNETLTTRLAELATRSVTVVFTSSNAVTAIASAMRPNWEIFCLSGATRHAAAERFGENAIIGTAGSARELAETLIDRKPPGECWFFCGDKRRDELPDTLLAAGWRVHEVVVYQTILTPHHIGKPYDAIVFFSPSAVESFFSMNTIGPQIGLFAIGRTTAAAVSARCQNPIVISTQPDEQTLIRQIIERLDAARPKDKH